MENIIVYPDGSVRNAVGTIFQFTYGDDGFDASELEKTKTPRWDIASFINLRRAVGKINATFGYTEEGEADEEDNEEEEIEYEDVEFEEE